MHEALITKAFPVQGGAVTVQNVPTLIDAGGVVGYRVSVTRALETLCRAAQPGDTVAYDPALETGPPPFITAIKAEMDRQGVTQAELARRLAVPPSQVSRWFARPGHLEHRSLELIAHALNCTLTITLTLKEPQ